MTTTSMTVTNEYVNQLTNISLSNVNTAILASVPEHLKADTETLLKCSQYKSGVDIVFCSYLYKLKSNPSLFKNTPYKNYGNYCKDVLRVDNSQSTKYANMFEKLFVDVDEPYEKLKDVNSWTVAQLVAIAAIKDRIIRKLFIRDIVTSEYSCTNIKKAVDELNTYDRDKIELINWNEITGILKNGKITKKTENATTENATAENATAENATTENATAENATAENKNICKFTNIKDFEKWYKTNKDNILEIVITLK